MCPAPTPAPAPAPAPTPDPAPAPAPVPGFGSGTFRVGVDIAPGIYITSAAGCYWERNSDLSGELSGVIVNSYESDTYLHIVEVKPTDVAFTSEDCGRWQPYGGAAPTAIGDGDWVVNGHLAPGRWRADAPGCYWERATGWGHVLSDEIITNHYGDGPTIVDIPATDVRFTSSGCGVWTRIA